MLVQSQTNFAFKGDTTYLVMDSVNLSGSTTIEDGTVVKYTNAVASPKLSITGTILCQTGPYRPAVFTAKDDNTVGETLLPSNGELFVVHWTGTAFDVTRITDGKPPEVDPRQFEHAVSAPLSIPSIP